MGRSPCCDENGLKKGPWTQEEDEKLLRYIKKNGHGSWRTLPRLAGLNRCGKSCRLRWTNYLRPDIKRGKFSAEEEQTILQLHAALGNKWSAIAAHLPGRTDNEIKNLWNTHLKKRLIHMGFDPITHRPRTDDDLVDLFAALPHLIALAALRDQLQLAGAGAGAPDLPQLQLTAAALGLVAGGLCPPQQQQLTAAALELDYYSSSTTTTAPVVSSSFPVSSSEEGEAANNSNNNNQQQQTAAGLVSYGRAGADDAAPLLFACHGGGSSSSSLPPLTDLSDATANSNLPTASSSSSFAGPAASSSNPLPACWPELFFFPDDDDPFVTDFL